MRFLMAIGGWFTRSRGSCPFSRSPRKGRKGRNIEDSIFREFESCLCFVIEYPHGVMCDRSVLRSRQTRRLPIRGRIRCRFICYRTKKSEVWSPEEDKHPSAYRPCSWPLQPTRILRGKAPRCQLREVMRESITSTSTAALSTRVSEPPASNAFKRPPMLSFRNCRNQRGFGGLHCAPIERLPSCGDTGSLSPPRHRCRAFCLDGQHLRMAICTTSAAQRLPVEQLPDLLESG
jgi:hypothetical protein